MLSTQVTLEEQESHTLLIEDPSLTMGLCNCPSSSCMPATSPAMPSCSMPSSWAMPGRSSAASLAIRGCAMTWMPARIWCANICANWSRCILLSQRRRGLGRTNIYTLHDLRTAKIEVQEPHKNAVQESRKIEGLEPQESKDYEETDKTQTDKTQTAYRTIGERPVKKSLRNAENEEKALGWG